MGPDFFPSVIHCLLLDVPNMHDAQIGTSSFKSINIHERTPIFASLNMDLVWRRDKLSFHGLNSYFKGDSTSGNRYSNFFLCEIL